MGRGDPGPVRDRDCSRTPSGSTRRGGGLAYASALRGTNDARVKSTKEKEASWWRTHQHNKVLYVECEQNRKAALKIYVCIVSPWYPCLKSDCIQSDIKLGSARQGICQGFQRLFSRHMIRLHRLCPRRNNCSCQLSCWTRSSNSVNFHSHPFSPVLMLAFFECESEA
jgi:hypothetical protein